MDVDALELEINNLEKLSNNLVFLRTENFDQQKRLEIEILKHEGDTAILSKVGNLFKHLLDSLLDEKKQEVQNLVTYGLKTVFNDQDLKFHIEIEPRASSVHTSFKTEQVGVTQGDVLENFGGGIVNLESFLLRIITLFQTKLSSFLFLDESFANLSDDYSENCSLLLKNLCNQLGLTIFLITHNELMLNSADKVYKAGSVDNRFTLTEIKNG
jgi:DNA repair exonuclease SbcCD ATPase subunit